MFRINYVSLWNGLLGYLLKNPKKKKLLMIMIAQETANIENKIGILRVSIKELEKLYLFYKRMSWENELINDVLNSIKQEQKLLQEYKRMYPDLFI